MKAFAISLFVVARLLLKLIERLGSVEVGSLLFRDLMVFQYVVWLCLWSQLLLMCSFHISCLWSDRLLFISWLSSDSCGLCGFALLSRFLF